MFHLTDTLINFHLDPGLYNLAQNEQQSFKNNFTSIWAVYWVPRQCLTKVRKGSSKCCDCRNENVILNDLDLKFVNKPILNVNTIYAITLKYFGLNPWNLRWKAPVCRMRETARFNWSKLCSTSSTRAITFNNEFQFD